MRIFGLEIRKASKVDYEEAEQFKQLVAKLYDELNAYGRDLESFSVEHIDARVSAMIFNHVENIKSYLKLYEDNKFSQPGECFSLIYHIGELEKKSVAFNKVVANARRTIVEDLRAYATFMQQQVMHGHEDDDDDDEYDIDERVYRFRDKLQEIHTHIKYIETHIDILLLIIKYDAVKIAMGVDLVMEYKNRQKRIKLNGGDTLEYKVSFIHKRSGGNQNERNGT